MTEPSVPHRTTTVSESTTTRTQVTTSHRGPVVGAVVSALDASERIRGTVAAGAEWLGRTVSVAGWFVLSFATVGVACGWLFGWVEWLVAGSAAVLLLAMCAPFLFGARGYDVSVRLRHERVVAGSVVDGEIDIRNRSSRTTLPGRIDLPVGDGLVELGVPMLRAGHRVAQPVTIPALRRGVIVVGPPTAVRSDPVGLLRREHEWEGLHELYVHPKTVAVPSTSSGFIHDLEGSPSRRLVDSDLSFHAIRGYAPGDSRRQIHWKSTAKTGQLMVRQFEESLRSRLAVLLSVARAEYASENEFELAVSAAASLSAQAVRDAREVSVVTGAEIPRVVRGRMRSIETLSASSPRALLDGFSRLSSLEHTMPLEDVCRLTVDASDALSSAFIVCGSELSLTRLRQAAVAFSSDTAVVAVVCDERAQPRMRAFHGLTVLTVGVLEDLSALLLRGVQS